MWVAKGPSPPTAAGQGVPLVCEPVPRATSVISVSRTSCTGRISGSGLIGLRFLIGAEDDESFAAPTSQRAARSDGSPDGGEICPLWCRSNALWENTVHSCTMKITSACGCSAKYTCQWNHGGLRLPHFKPTLQCRHLAEPLHEVCFTCSKAMCPMFDPSVAPLHVSASVVDTSGSREG